MRVRARFTCKCGAVKRQITQMREDDVLWDRKPACPRCDRRMQFKGAELL